MQENEEQWSDYAIELGLVKGLLGGEPNEIALDRYDVTIMWIHGKGDDEERREAVGSAVVFLVRSQREEAVFDACDAESQELHDMWSALCKPGSTDSTVCELREEDGWDRCDGSDILYLSEIRIEEAHRRRGLGLLVTSWLIDILQYSCGVVVLDALPPGAAELPREQRQRAHEALARYWGAIGFSRLRGTYLALDPCRRRPLTTRQLLEVYEPRLRDAPGAAERAPATPEA
jgi:hypothetical protein